MSIPILNQRRHREKTIVVQRNDGSALAVKVPSNVNLDLVRRAFADLKRGEAPLYLTTDEHLFVADVIGAFAEQDQARAEAAKAAPAPQEETRG